ncbi:MAG: cellulase family glycosylhydrolase [Thermoproteota archaeon]
MQSLKRKAITICFPIALIIATVFLTHYFLAPGFEESSEEPLNISFYKITVSREEPKAYEPTELNIELEGAVNNPFNEYDVNITSDVYLPNGETFSLQAFLYQEYERKLVNDAEVLTAIGKPFWKLRFTPTLEGNYEVKIYLYSKGKLIDSRNITVRVNGFSQNPGFARFKGNYLVCDNGSDLFLIGENVCWYSSPKKTYDYDTWFEKISKNGMNYARIWLAPWAFAIEWSDRIGNYNLEEAWRLDYVIKLAEERGIYLMLCIVNHGQLRKSDDWNKNPYNKARGGLLSSPEQFFIDQVAKDFFKKKLRCLVSRYSYSTYLLAWEFFNEVDLTDNYNPVNIANWHREMADYLRMIDPYKHPITTSFANPEEGNLTWKESGLDFTQTHIYGPKIGDLANALFREIERKASIYEKPTLIGEFSIDWRWIGISTEQPYYYKDVEGVGIHEGIWASCMGGSFGTAMTWWWDVYVEPYNLYYHYKALRSFLGDISFSKSNLSKLRCSMLHEEKHIEETDLEIFGLSNLTFAIGWIRNKDYNWFNAINNVSLKIVGNISLEVFGLKAGRYSFEIYNTYSGEKIEVKDVIALEDRLILNIPAFIKDIAFKIIYVEPYKATA